MMAARDAIRRGLRWLGTSLMLLAIVAASTRPILWRASMQAHR